MNNSYTVQLKFSSLKILKTGLSHPHYYLVAYGSEEMQVVTSVKNLMLDDSSF
jgi:hypothetical protein